MSGTNINEYTDASQSCTVNNSVCLQEGKTEVIRTGNLKGSFDLTGTNTHPYLSELPVTVNQYIFS